MFPLNPIKAMPVFSRGVLLSLLAFGLLNSTPGSAADLQAKWELKPGDRVVMLGSTFIERENTQGVLEMSLRLAAPETNFTVRNLGWSGDNVLGESRAYFGPVEQGYKHILEYVQLTNPTVLIVSYGQNAAFNGEERLKDFITNYERLLKDLSAENRRIIVLGPTPLEPMVRSPEVVNAQNETRNKYGQAIQQMCESNGYVYVDMLESMQQVQKTLKLDSLTENGVHLHHAGYIAAGEVLANSLGRTFIKDNESILQDSQFAAQVAPVYEKILWKNELFFHRFRPQNETYLRGFRKHEQGQNAKEILEFEPLIEEQDQKLQTEASKVLKNWAR
ncbi:MAG TPA: hypothetical protein DD473_14450 [Planctomycetaceae bacterium]|nr:hypothetical protein [Planctomycetaceae bacterium]